MSTLLPATLKSLLRVDHGDPFAVLGLHETPTGLVVRIFRPDAKTAAVVDATDPTRTWPATCLDASGLFEAKLTGQKERLPYRLKFTGHTGDQWEAEDAYRFHESTFGEADAYLFGEGNHFELWKKMGAHLETHDGVAGTMFRVWGPNAQRVSVVGDWNAWDGRVHQMRKIIPTGVWEIFVPGVEEGAHYKYELLGGGHLHTKSDPWAFYNEHGTDTASMVWRLDKYQWGDADWMAKRATTQWQRAPISIYEVHPGSWRRNERGFLTWAELAVELLDYVVDMGYTHIELMGVAEYPFEGSWGYQVTGYFAPTSRYGTPDDFRAFVNRAHERGIGILLDWVPGHFPKDAHGLARFDGTALYEHADPRQGEHQDWGTLIFNYGRNEVRNFLIANALFWMAEYHIDGLRVDAVASMLYLDYSREAGQWLPNALGGRENLEAIYFLKRCNEVCHEKHPGVLSIAEESTAWPGVSRPTFLGGLGFGFKWNMGWMHDTLAYMALDPIYRRYHHGQATFSLVYAFHEHFILVLSHDEVVHGKGALINKMPGDEWQQFANLRLLYAWMWTHPGKKLLFMGCEWGQRNEWSHERALDWWVLQFPVHSGLQRLVRQLNYLYKNEPALFDQDDAWDGFEWIDLHDADNSVLVFLRKARHGSHLVVVVNATPLLHEGYRIGVPHGGFWREILNTDSEDYGGTNAGNAGGVQAAELPWMGRSHSLGIVLPPLGVMVFKPGES
jgi:1,4-alpha-glucan branching enzyme